jgi:hypothetical protein
VPTLRLTDDAVVLIQSLLAKGYTVIAPSRAARMAANGMTEETSAFWRVDPRTGTTLGLGPNGMGTSEAEYAFIGTWVGLIYLCELAAIGYRIGGAKIGLMHIGMCMANPAIGYVAIVYKDGTLPATVKLFESVATGDF